MKKYPNGTGVFYVYYEQATNECSATYSEVKNAIAAGAFPVMVVTSQQNGNTIYVPLRCVNRVQEMFEFTILDNGTGFNLTPEGVQFFDRSGV